MSIGWVSYSSSACRDVRSWLILIVLAASQALLATKSTSEEGCIGQQSTSSILHKPVVKGASASLTPLKVVFWDFAGGQSWTAQTDTVVE